MGDSKADKKVEAASGIYIKKKLYQPLGVVPRYIPSIASLLKMILTLRMITN